MIHCARVYSYSAESGEYTIEQCAALVEAVDEVTSKEAAPKPQALSQLRERVSLLGVARHRHLLHVVCDRCDELLELLAVGRQIRALLDDSASACELAAAVDASRERMESVCAWSAALLSDISGVPLNNESDTLVYFARVCKLPPAPLSGKQSLPDARNALFQAFRALVELLRPNASALYANDERSVQISLMHRLLIDLGGAQKLPRAARGSAGSSSGAHAAANASASSSSGGTSSKALSSESLAPESAAGFKKKRHQAGKSSKVLKLVKSRIQSSAEQKERQQKRQAKQARRRLEEQDEEFEEEDEVTEQSDADAADETGVVLEALRSHSASTPELSFGSDRDLFVLGAVENELYSETPSESEFSISQSPQTPRGAHLPSRAAVASSPTDSGIQRATNTSVSSASPGAHSPARRRPPLAPVARHELDELLERLGSPLVSASAYVSGGAGDRREQLVLTGELCRPTAPLYFTERAPAQFASASARPTRVPATSPSFHLLRASNLPAHVKFAYLQALVRGELFIQKVGSLYPRSKLPDAAHEPSNSTSTATPTTTPTATPTAPAARSSSGAASPRKSASASTPTQADQSATLAFSYSLPERAPAPTPRPTLHREKLQENRYVTAVETRAIARSSSGE